jgi:tetratricopeptide (TPR) repeat protein
MTPQELKDTAQLLFQARRYAEALPLLRSATEALPDDESLWRDLVLSALWTGQNNQAAEFAKQGVHEHLRSDWLWRQLGNALTLLDDLPAAENALNNARRLNPNAHWLWRNLAELYRKQKRPQQEIEALEKLRELGAANSTDFNQLGIAYHDLGNFAKAVENYRRSAAVGSNCEPLFNMGLVFRRSEVSLITDATDAFRRALALKPDDARAKEELKLARNCSSE